MRGVHTLESLSEFVASAFEFLVGGILFTMSVVFLLTGGSTLPSLSESEKLLPIDSTLVSIVFVALAYTMGVVGESVARSPFEILLDRITVRTDAFFQGNGAPANQEGSASGTRGTWRNRITELALGREYTIRQLDLARAERERQRAKVMTCHESLHAEVQGQLKRLRLERVFWLSMAVTTVALAIRGYWQYTALGLVFTVCLVWVVNTRFKRYCGAIARAYKLVEEENLKQMPQEGT